jgi:hypothetical protein
MEVGGRGQVFGREYYHVHVCESEASLLCAHEEKPNKACTTLFCTNMIKRTLRSVKNNLILE